MKHEEESILKVEGVGKDYMLGAVTGETLKDAFRKRKTESELHNKKFTALDSVSFEVKRGETVGLIGSNGAGKSTLLKLISRITAPTRGTIYIDGRVASMLEVGTGFHQELTGRENIYLNGSILGMSKKEIDEKLESIIEFSECGEFIDTPVKRYSSGMYVKLAFSVAAHLDSEIMIMDEVLAVGDVKFQQKCLNKMKEVAEKEGRTILYVSHNMDTIRKLCKRCLVLQSGRLVLDGTVEEAVKLYMGEHLRTATSIDFTTYLRPGWLGREDVRLTGAEYPAGEAKVTDDKPLALSMKWRCNQPVTNMGIRVELMDGEERPFATAVCYDVFSGEAGAVGEATLRVDVGTVKNGTYKTYYTLFCVDAYGQSVDLDCVIGLDVVVDRTYSSGELLWRNASWGNIELPQPEIVIE